VPAASAAGTALYVFPYPQPAAPSGRTLSTQPMQTEWRSEGGETIAAPTHIIERPRLIKLMEESGARVIVLNAPAGYGKTTLAHEWARSRDADVTWYRCNPASGDIAALAAGLASSLAAVVPQAGSEMLQRIRTSADPSADVDVLSELLTESLLAWPQGAWLVLDDHHFVAASATADALIQSLVFDTSLQILATSRVRPDWASTRRILYGEIFDLDQANLAFTEAETDEVLRGWNNALAAQAEGWPAVVGLASRLGENAARAALPTELFDFLAEELYREVPTGLRKGLLELALYSSFDSQTLPLTRRLFEHPSMLLTLERLGFLQRTNEGEVGMHPLLRSFLVEKLRRSDSGLSRRLPMSVGLDLIAHGQWDDAFAVQAAFPEAQLLVPLLETAVDDLLDAGRLATVRTWVELAHGQALRHPVVDLAAAKLALREADHGAAEALASAAAEAFAPDHSARASALITAGQAASLGDRTLAARDFFGRARLQARTPVESREALLGDFFAALELEHPDTTDILESLEDIDLGDLPTRLRLETARLLSSVSAGDLHCRSRFANCTTCRSGFRDTARKDDRCRLRGRT
jgi:ATP/maltotriose-dependent transcriptional regulator MalT